MKTIILMLVYIGTFIGLFMLLSIAGILWIPYKEVLKQEGWILIYMFFIGWWTALFPTLEYYSNNKEYFDKVFK
jgi:hypothetical protein